MFLTKYLVLTQGEPVRTLAEIAKQKFTSVANRKEKSSTYQTRKTCGNSIKAGSRQPKGEEGGKKVATAVIRGKEGKRFQVQGNAPKVLSVHLGWF